jgi:hypothetical protein
MNTVKNFGTFTTNEGRLLHDERRLQKDEGRLLQYKGRHCKMIIYYSQIKGDYGKMKAITTDEGLLRQDDTLRQDNGQMRQDDE